MNKKEYKKIVMIKRCPNHKNVKVYGYVFCERCRKKNLLSQKKIHNKAKFNGKCIFHPKRESVLNKTMCLECLSKLKVRNDKRILRCKKYKKCFSHPNRDAVPGKQRCQECLWKGVLTANGINLTDKQATKILEKQNYRCPLSNRLLVKGINTSPDHIIPIGKNRNNPTHKLNNIKNIRFVDTEVNQVLSDLSDDEYIKLCKEVAKHH